MNPAANRMLPPPWKYIACPSVVPRTRKRGHTRGVCEPMEGRVVRFEVQRSTIENFQLQKSFTKS